MPRLLARLLCIGLLIAATGARAEKIMVAAASDLKFAMNEIVANFRLHEPGHDIQVVYGSSGKFHTQIQQGAPYDLYFSADIAYPRALAKAGFAASPVQPYAVGRLVLWSASLDARQLRLSDLADPKITRIAIANPKHAPYGQRAVEALRAAGVWQQTEPKLVYGENIAQAAQFVQTGNAEVGIIALSLAMSPALSGLGGYWLMPDTLHQPLTQGFVITRRAKTNALARRFAQHMGTPQARAVMSGHGFALPGDASAAR